MVGGAKPRPPRTGGAGGRLSDQRDDARRDDAMPSLFRFLTVVAVIGGLIYGAVFALANFVNPKPREMTVTIQPDKFLKK
jgi:hypothetical protein